MKKLRWAGTAAIILAPFFVTGCASNHFGFGHKSGNDVAVPMSERTCLMRAMYFESNRSSRDGMIAVGTVVMNRVNSTAYPKTICGVVGQPNQFAPGVLTKPMNEPAAMARAGEAADAVLRGERAKKSKNAMFFHTAGLTFPYKNIHYVQVAGGNAFYEKRGRNGELQVPTNDAPYDVAFAFAQERNGNAPQFTTPGRSVERLAPKTVDPTPAVPVRTAPAAAPVMVAQAQPVPVGRMPVASHNKLTAAEENTFVAQAKPASNVNNKPVETVKEPSLPFQTAPTPAPKPVMVAQARYNYAPKPQSQEVDHIHTGSTTVGYPTPSKEKIDQIGAILQKQEKNKRF
ncbi:cell wall hydrolase [uncultured Bartonella sp.]|uniref:cell wall hydrolase n=1 Tax=uncultured Bartonella sp. TaxID=104108 RepID=UPI002605F14C|nr:cell wall hydrolase [uncultured Bartonella sp.]